MEDVVNNLQRMSKGCDILIIWTDCDREGEHIGWEISNVCLTANSRIKVCRAKFSSIYKNEIFNCLENLGSLNLNLISAVETRIELDLRSGAMLTRLQTMFLKPRHPEVEVVSYGSCQFPTLSLIVYQYFKLKAFKSQNYWTIKLICPGENKKITEFFWKRRRIFDRLICLILYEKCCSRPCTVKIVDSIQKETKKFKPLPLRTVELQKFLSKFMKISSKKIMEFAENLYNNGYISYPRTETDCFDNSFDFKSKIKILMDNRLFNSYSEALLNKQMFDRPRNGKNNDKAHPPIHPLKNGMDLEDGPMKAIFEFIARRFLACCSNDALGIKTVIKAQLGNETFFANGLKLVKSNFLDIYIYEKWREGSIDDFIEGHDYFPSEILMEESKTTPPNLLDESSLVSLMDKNKIGTDATIHEHISKLIERKYTIEVKNRFCPTILGLSLIESYNSNEAIQFLVRTKSRSILEQDIDKIAEGLSNKITILNRILNQFQNVYDELIRNLDRLEESLDVNLKASNRGILDYPSDINLTNSPSKRATDRSRKHTSDDILKPKYKKNKKSKFSF